MKRFLCTASFLAASAGAMPTTANVANGEVAYYSLSPPFVINLSSPQGLGFLQLSAQVSVEESENLEAVKHHIPLIRHAVIMSLSGQDVAQVVSVDGREAIRRQVLERIQSLLTQKTGDPRVTGLYFTSFVTQ